MRTSLAALVFPNGAVPLPALVEGFAVALAGYDAPAPRLELAELRGAAGYTAAYYASGLPPGPGSVDDELEHALELFDADLPPALVVRSIARERFGAPASLVVHAVVLDDALPVDDVWRFDEAGLARRFLREGDDGLEAGVVSGDEALVEPVELDLDDEASEDDERAAVALASKSHGGTAWLAGALGATRVSVAGALGAGLFDVERRVPVRLVEPDAASIATETRRLVAALRRTEGRGGFVVPDAVAGVTPPASYRAFVAAYDWADPTDPGDRYREVAIGRIEGTLTFLRGVDLAARGADAGFAAAARGGLFPVGSLARGPLGSADRPVTVALGADGAELFVVEPAGRVQPAGPTFGELVRYLALGFSTRSPLEESTIGALMLRARVRVAD